MTAQIGDSYSYKGGDYSIVAMSNPLRFDPRFHGFKPESTTSACWNGFWCKYKISEDGIFLDKLYIHSQDDEYPELNGNTFEVDAEGNPVEYMGHRVYNDLNMKVEYHGKILVGDEFIHDYYVHMGYQRAHAYKVLKEFVFQNGNLIDGIDHSEMAAKLREMEDAKNKKPSLKEKLFGKSEKSIHEFVETSFSLDYKDKCWWMD